MNEQQEHVLDELRQLAASGEVARFLAVARELQPADLSDVLAGLEPDLQLRVVQTLPPEVVSEALAEMEEEEHPEELLAALHPEDAADIVEELEDDDAVDLIAELPVEQAARILTHVADRADIERLLVYDEETAGGRMTAHVVAVPDRVSAGQAIDEVRRQAEHVEEFYQIFVVDDEHRLVGILPLQRMVVAKPATLVRDLMEPPPVSAAPELDQEEVARLMSRYNVPAVPVVGPDGKLLGRVTFDDVIDVVEAEQTEDLLKFGGGAGDEQLAGTWQHAVRSRLPWLYLNLFTALFAGAVVLAFEDTISQIVALAAVMPIVAGLGGSAGTQALAVTVRRIALGLIPARSGVTLVGKEMLVGLINGLAIGAAVGLVTVATGRPWELALVVMAAMWGSLIVAATVGAAVPLMLQRLGVDPAVASSGFVTAVTDIAGFFILLGLAATLLLPGT
ncbi:MAG: magnesium transporter [Gemmatimonadota bacterium]|nr:MAG: magnesium transporter [Gemmatimonadota bacterium]